MGSNQQHRRFASLISALAVVFLVSSAWAAPFEAPAVRQKTLRTILDRAAVPRAHPDAIRRGLDKYGVNTPHENIRVVPPDKQHALLEEIIRVPMIGMRVDVAGHPRAFICDGKQALEFDGFERLMIRYEPFRTRVVSRGGILFGWALPQDVATKRLTEMKRDAHARTHDKAPACTVYLNQVFGWTRGLVDHLSPKDPNSPFHKMPRDDPGVRSFDTDDPNIVGAPRVMHHMGSPDVVLALPTDRYRPPSDRSQVIDQWGAFVEHAGKARGGWEKGGVVDSSFPIGVVERSLKHTPSE